MQPPTIYSRFIFVLSCLVASFALGQGMSFSVTFEDVDNATGVGFDHPANGSQRRSAFLSAANDLAGNFNHPGASVSLHVLTSETDGNGAPVVGKACHGVSQFATNGGFYEPYSLLQAESPTYSSSMVCPEGGTMNVRFDFGDGFDYDSSDGVVGWDFETVAKHGMVRGMGYGSDGNVAGPDTPYGESTYNPSRYRSFDSMSEYLHFDVDGTEPLWGPVGNYHGEPTIPLTDGDVFFHDGPFGNVFPMSLGGENQMLFSGVGSDLMSPLQRGIALPDLSSNDVAALSAIGWDIQSVVPEPSSHGLGIIGLLFLFGTARRKR